MKHFIITRINVVQDCLAHKGRTTRRMKLLQHNEAYLDHRIQMFNRFTIPSVQSQTDKNFEWLILIHPDTDSKYKKAFNAGTLVEVARDTEVLAKVKQDGWIATTNLDSDDALAFDFMSNLRVQVREENCVISFPAGYVFSCRSNQAVGRRSSSNAYKTLVERGEDPKTVCAYFHGILHTVYPEKQVKSLPMWLQTVHGKNIDNHQVRHSKNDRDISLRTVQERFRINNAM